MLQCLTLDCYWVVGLNTQLSKHTLQLKHTYIWEIRYSVGHINHLWIRCMLYLIPKLIYKIFSNSPVHVVLVSLLVDQLSNLFLSFFGRPKKNLFSLREFLVRLWFFWSTKFLFGIPKFLFSIPKNQSLTKKNSETDQKFPETEQIFFWSTKKSDK